ncbi:MAG: DUF3108 domain-containing protein [bacterium]|nr:DUF3108 domain-containing protein [bacterium]
MKKIFLLLAISCLGFCEELLYDIKMFGIKAGTQKISQVEEENDKIRLISETKTNSFFSKFYKVDDYIEVITNKKDILPEYLLQRINEGKYHGLFEVKFNQRKKTALITSNGEEKETEVPEKTYDIISLIYYLRNISLYPGYSEVFCLITKGELKRITIVVKEKSVTIKKKIYDVYEVEEERLDHSEGGIKIWFEKESKVPLMIKVPTSAGTITATLKR